MVLMQHANWDVTQWRSVSFSLAYLTWIPKSIVRQDCIISLARCLFDITVHSLGSLRCLFDITVHLLGSLRCLIDITVHLLGSLWCLI